MFLPGMMRIQSGLHYTGHLANKCKEEKDVLRDFLSLLSVFILLALLAGFTDIHIVFIITSILAVPGTEIK